MLIRCLKASGHSKSSATERDFLKLWKSGLHKCTHINAKWNKLILMKFTFLWDSTASRYKSTFCKLFLDLWSKFMFAISREGEHFSFTRAHWARVTTSAHSIGYNCIGSICISVQASAFMYNFSIHCVTDVQFDGGLLLRSRYNVTFLSPSKWIKERQI